MGTAVERSQGRGEGDGGLLLEELQAELPADLARQVFTHASWTERRSDSYERLAFLGDAVLALAITAHLYPRLQGERFGAGRLTKIRAQAVSGPACHAVANRLGLRERLEGAAPEGSAEAVRDSIATQRVLASVLEALIGACFLQFGYERTAEAVVEAFAPEIDRALNHPVDFKSTLQEQLAREGQRARYELLSESGPPHRRWFKVAVLIGDRVYGEGAGPSKKVAQQEAARQALERLG
jgi:ribonuclease-3